jgi:putative DNA primase/helicase
MGSHSTHLPGHYPPRKPVIWGDKTNADATKSSLIAAALAVAASGLPVFPCSVPKKKPITEHGFKNATLDPTVIREMFARDGAALIGVPTGRVSKRVVIDIDPRHNGDAWLRENQHRLPPTLTQSTRGGGMHLVFRDPSHVEIRNSDSRIAPGVDVRGTGGYQIVPPSEGYAVRDDTLPAEMPPWLVTACLKPEPPPPPPRSCRPPLAGDGSPYGLKALEEECIAVQRAPFGKQEITLNNAALKIGSLVAGKELAEGYALAELIAAGNAMPNESGRELWRPAEIEKKVRRAFADGARSPRSAPPPIFTRDREQPRQQRDAGAQGNGTAGGEDDKPSGGGDQKPAPPILPAPSAPVLVARQFVESRCLHNGTADALTIRFWCGSWWTWQTTHWVEAQPRVIRPLLYEFTADAVYFDPKENKTKPWSPNRYKINDLLDALSSLVILPDDIEQPCWINHRKTGPIVATSNGLLDVVSFELHPHTPLYFGHVSVPFPYDPKAPEPTKWLGFLNELWPNQADAIAVLGEWFGYVISGRLDLHKILVMVGPTRGGKGLIARILTALVGKGNVCGPTLNSLGGDFGLAPLLGKSLAIISDARSGGGKNSSVVVERLLSISGEDTLTVNRKYKDQWNGKLSVRFHIISNELPNLGDASSAIIGRLVLLLTTQSWLGKENHQLETQLSAELTGILNWSLQGLRRLAIDNKNQFTRFEAADEAITTMQDLASPVGAFVRERCKLEGNAEIATDDLYAGYKTWCELSEYPKSPKAHFGRDLRAACPSVRKRRPRDGKERHSVYAGIRLRREDEEPVS